MPPAFSRLTGGPPRRQVAGYAVAVLGTVALTLSLVPFRNDITPLSKGFGYLVIVVAAAAVGGIGPGLVASVFGFLTFNFYFLPPYNTFVIGKGEYVVVLFVFLGLSVMISALLARAQERAGAAEARQAELQALQSLSARLVSLPPGPDGYRAVIEHLLGEFGFSAGALFTQHQGELRGLKEQVAVGCDMGVLPASWDPRSGDAPLERLPLSVGGRSLGLLVLQPRPKPLTPAESRVLRAFCDQFALVLERDRLLKGATDAEVLRQADEVRRSLLAAVSHDLRSPLAAIKTSVTDLLSEDSSRDSTYVREALASINAEADRLNALIANLLDMSRIEGGMLKARSQAVDLAEVVDACADRIMRQWPRVDVQARVDRSALVRADPVFLERVVTNLLENAAKAASDSASALVEVTGGRMGDSVTARVIDHGSGVPGAAREQLFYPFYRMSQRHPRLGTGLGLAISKGFLALMDGDVWIEETPGGGATFAFTLPAVLEPAPLVAPAER